MIYRDYFIRIIFSYLFSVVYSILLFCPAQSGLGRVQIKNLEQVSQIYRLESSLFPEKTEY